MPMKAELLRAVDHAMTVDDYVHRSAIVMHMLGRCRRQGAYALRDGWPEEPTDSSPQAYLGRAIHKELLRDLAWQLGGEYEVPVTLFAAGLHLKGTADLVLEDTVTDLKTTSDNWYGVVTARVPWGNRLQTTGYAMALGKENCALLYVNRSTGERSVDEWPTAQYMDAVVEWIADCIHLPEEVPRDERGPGLSMICDDCPWKQECWGPLNTSRAPQAVVVDELGAEMVLQEYDAARERAKKAKADQEFWRACLDGAQTGGYGPWELGWTGGKPKPVTDVEEAVRLLEKAGLPIPTKTSYSKRSISVKRRKLDEIAEITPAEITPPEPSGNDHT